MGQNFEMLPRQAVGGKATWSGRDRHCLLVTQVTCTEQSWKATVMTTVKNIQIPNVTPVWLDQIRWLVAKCRARMLFTVKSQIPTTKAKTHMQGQPTGDCGKKSGHGIYTHHVNVWEERQANTHEIQENTVLIQET